MFSDAISSISWRCRPSSPRIAAAISGSACSSVAVKNESGAEAVLALLAEVLMGEISPPPQPARRAAGGHGWRSEAALAGYHIGRRRPSTCGTRLLFMQDMVGIGWDASLRRPGEVEDCFAVNAISHRYSLSRGAIRPSYGKTVRPKKRAQGTPGARCTRRWGNGLPGGLPSKPR